MSSYQIASAFVTVSFDTSTLRSEAKGLATTLRSTLDKTGRDAGRQFVTNFMSNLDGLGRKFHSAGVKAGKEFADGLRSQVRTSNLTVPSVKGAGRTDAAALHREGLELGKAMVSGVKAGTKNLIPTITSQLDSLGKRFYKAGQDSGREFAIGMRSQLRTPNVSVPTVNGRGRGGTGIEAMTGLPSPQALTTHATRSVSAMRTVSTGIGRESKKATMAISQLGFAVEDFFTVFSISGWQGGFRAANNNLSQMASILNPMAGVIVGVGAALLTAFVPALLRTGEEADFAAAAIGRLDARAQEWELHRTGLRENASFGQRLTETKTVDDARMLRDSVVADRSIESIVGKSLVAEDNELAGQINAIIEQQLRAGLREFARGRVEAQNAGKGLFGGVTDDAIEQELDAIIPRLKAGEKIRPGSAVRGFERLMSIDLEDARGMSTETEEQKAAKEDLRKRRADKQREIEEQKARFTRLTAQQQQAEEKLNALRASRQGRRSLYHSSPAETARALLEFGSGGLSAAAASFGTGAGRRDLAQKLSFAMPSLGGIASAAASAPLFANLFNGSTKTKQQLSLQRQIAAKEAGFGSTYGLEQLQSTIQKSIGTKSKTDELLEKLNATESRSQGILDRIEDYLQKQVARFG
jgi:hypothetical protein